MSHIYFITHFSRGDAVCICEEVIYGEAILMSWRKWVVVPTVSRPNRRPAAFAVRGWGLACMHCGCSWHVSLTTGFRCVDLRKFFVPTDQTAWKPTKTGIALRLNEWPTFEQDVDKLHRDNRTVANFTPCFLNLAHTTPELIATCSECNPYPSTTT